MKKALSIHNLSKVYKNGLLALKGVDLEVEEGDFFALLGPNGAGKSTLIGIISSLINKSGGDVNIMGFDLDTQWHEARSCIGLVPQEFNFNVWEPVVEVLINQAGYYGIERALAKERAEYYLRKLGLWEKRFEMARNLSGGMKRRMMIARALVHEPRLLILDEPTAGVDIEIRRSMWAFFEEQNKKGVTIILTTHYLEEAESLCRNIAIIHKGDIIENTNMDSLLRKLHCETLVLSLRNELDELPDVHGCAVRQIDKMTLEVDVYQETGLTPIINMLSEKGIEVVSLRNKTNRLEELFMHIVDNKG